MHKASAARFRLRRERWEERGAEGGIGGRYSCWCCCWNCCERHDGQVVVLGNSVAMIAPVFMLEQKVSGNSGLMQYMTHGDYSDCGCKGARVQGCTGAQCTSRTVHRALLHPCNPATLHPRHQKTKAG